ncbi:MAG: hypothetical protein ACE5HI_08340 [bacterium]
MAKAINNTSGGIGKNEDSAKAKKNRAQDAYGVSAQCKTHSYSFLIKFFSFADSKAICWLGVSEVMAIDISFLYQKKLFK